MTYKGSYNIFTFPHWASNGHFRVPMRWVYFHQRHQLLSRAQQATSVEYYPKGCKNQLPMSLPQMIRNVQDLNFSIF